MFYRDVFMIFLDIPKKSLWVLLPKKAFLNAVSLKSRYEK